MPERIARMSAIDRASYEPAYVQLVNIIRRSIAAGDYQCGDKLPTEAELCAAFDVSPMTVRRAVGVLLDQGVVSTTRGRGTFVRPVRLATASFDLRGFYGLLSADGVTVKMLEARVLPAGPRAAERLQVPEQTRVVSITRLLQRDERPLIFHRAVITYDPTQPTVEAELDVTALRDLFEGGAGAAPSEASSSSTHPCSPSSKPPGCPTPRAPPPGSSSTCSTGTTTSR